MTGYAMWVGPELATAISALARNTGETPKQVVARVLGEHFKLAVPERRPGQRASGAARTGRPKGRK